MNSLVNSAQASLNYPIETVLINLFLSLILSLLISWIYIRTHKALSYSQSFTFSLVLLPLITTFVMMVVGNSLARAFTLLGAFTIIRFRTPIKETRDMAYIFFSLITGMAVGTNNYMIAVVSTIVILIVVVLMSRFNFGSMRRLDYILNFFIDAKNHGNYQELFDKYLKTTTLLTMNAHQRGEIIELIFNVKLLVKDDVKKFLSELQALQGITNVKLISSSSDLEY